MTTYKAKDFGIMPDTDVTTKLEEFFKMLKETGSEQKAIEFLEGEYQIDAEKLTKRMLFITNTVGDKEFEKGETPHLSRSPLLIDGVKNCTFDFHGAKFLIDKKATNMCLLNCQNVEVKNLTLCAKHPDLHLLTVTKKGKGFVDFEIFSDSSFEVKDGTLIVKGPDFCYDAVKKYKHAWHIAQIKKDTPNTVKRTSALFRGAKKVESLGENKIRISFFKTTFCDVGDEFYIFDNRRQYVGIFVDRGENITLDNVTQNFNYSLATVFQCTKNIKISNCTFAPKKDSRFKIASLADFIQICSCMGNVTIENNYFEGACDDTLNAHGIYFKVKGVKDKTVTASFSHPQTHGFNPIDKGDKVVFFNPLTLKQKAKTTVTDSKMLSEKEIELTLKSTKGIKRGQVLEDETKIPSVFFRHNTANRIITRQVLLTVKNHSEITDNHFISNSMSGISISDDPISWFESGACHDATIKNNTFDFCGATPVLIRPLNLIGKTKVHKNIKIENNTFLDYVGPLMDLRGCENIKIKGNKASKNYLIRQNNCENVIIEK